MKASNYNQIIKHKDKTLAFNSMTCALAEVDDKFIDILDNISNIKYDLLDDEKKEIYTQMEEGGYIVDDEIDEIMLLKYRNLNGKFNGKGLGLTIAPLLLCNFACPYCYESPKKGIMNDEVRQAIIKMIENVSKKGEPISITWYGGEPLLAKDLIFSMSKEIIKICNENNASYGAYIVTNGYLIDDEVVKGMKESNITGAQITIDGPPDIHNKRRRLKDSDKPTFNRIIENVKKVLKAGIEVTIRINIDKTNVNRLEELLDIFVKEGLTDCFISLGHVSSYTDACASISDTCLTTEEYAIESLQKQELLFNKGFNVKDYPNYPGIKSNYCCADSTSAFVIDLDGYMYKCWNDVGNVKRAVGNVKNFEDSELTPKMLKINSEYILWSPFDYKECKECEVLPICMGGCPYSGIKNGKTPNCEKWKYNLIDVLKKTYDQRTNG